MSEIALVAATLCCSLVTGLLLGFAVVTMPGLGTLGDRDFLRGFQVLDRVIQDRQPLFMVLWLGSVVSVVAAVALGWSGAAGVERLALAAAGAIWLLGVQLPTAVVNIPLNNEIQALDLETSPPSDVAAARERFEQRWTYWNAVRSGLGVVVSVLLALALLWT